MASTTSSIFAHLYTNEGAVEAVALFIREVLRQDPELAKRILEQSGMATLLAELASCDASHRQS
ncbi:MAG: hypothetical protein GH150_00905 [Hadesarchaea archaeon]|nr:hypothetical protein [Hadesarchaea archaeon]